MERAGAEEIEFSLPWTLPEGPDGRAHTVSELLPEGHDCYLRLFHPFVPWHVMPDYLEPVEPRMSWRQLADAAGVPFAATTTWRQLKAVLPVDPVRQSRPWGVWEGQLEAHTAGALFEALDRVGSGPYFFAFPLSTVVCTEDHRPLLFVAGSLDARHQTIQLIRARGYGAATIPEYVWPQDERWITCTDFDLTSTYIAADKATATRILEHPALEVLQVQLSTRIDSTADEATL